jgi:hypothetical protein
LASRNVSVLEGQTVFTGSDGFFYAFPEERQKIL